MITYHCTEDRKVTLCGLPVDKVDYVNTLWWDALKARNRCRGCLCKRPVKARIA